jgi:hypothetical protein
VAFALILVDDDLWQVALVVEDRTSQMSYVLSPMPRQRLHDFEATQHAQDAVVTTAADWASR